MRITCYGRGNMGGGLGKLWERAGHEVTLLGSEGGDVADADVILLAVPGGAIAEALEKVTGLEGKTTIDATNLWQTDPPPGFASNAEFVKSRTDGPVPRPSTSTSPPSSTRSLRPRNRRATSGAATRRRARRSSS